MRRSSLFSGLIALAAVPGLLATATGCSSSPPPVGQGTTTSASSTVPQAPPTVSNLYLKKDIFVHNFGNDLPEDTATRLWATQRVASTAAFETPATQAAWKTIPSWYFISSGDQIITPTSERKMAERADSQVTEFTGGSHLTLISHPDAVTAVIQSALDSVH
jgi:pimeloyl-ACP methyl ester carboxylesterase